MTCLHVIWVMVFTTFTMQGQTIIAVNDTVDLHPNIPVTINVLANDIIPTGDSVRIMMAGGSGNGTVVRTFLSGGYITYLAPHWGFNGSCSGKYYVKDIRTGDTSSARVIFRVHDYSYDSLYLNNINARFNADGIHFIGSTGAKFEVPKFSGKSTIFLQTLWIGGLTNDSILHLAGYKYGQGPGMGPAGTKTDYWAGPVMDSSAYSIYQDTVWNYIWNLKKTEIEYHKTHWNLTGYTPIHDILTWPGNGNVLLGEAAMLAPFFDRNGDGIYQPMDGDYPLIKGDQSLFFIFNEDRNFHSETEGRKMRVEIHGMAYAFDLPGDSAFNNTIFMNYKIFNRSANTYLNSFVGWFTDLDIGYPNDDYVGCDVERSSFFGYNGTPVDGTGQPGSYGAHPPAQAVTLLGGPYLDPDGIDNPKFDGRGHQLCNESVNGLNFGDSIIDNERYGMRRFVYFNNSVAGVPLYMTDPTYAVEYYQMLQGIWKDNTRMIYGGNGHIGTGGYGPACDFMFPGNSDTLNWGVGCEPPQGPKYWTERTAHNNPSDRRGFASMGPFTFLPGAVEELDVSYTFARDYNGPDSLGSIGKLMNYIDTIRHAFIGNRLPNGGSFNGIGINTAGPSLKITVYPNPANTFAVIELDGLVSVPSTIRIIDYTGYTLINAQLKPQERQIRLNLSDLPSGLYLINFISGSQMVTKKISVIR